MKALFLIVALFATLSATAQDENPFVCKDGDKAVWLEFEDNLQYLELNKPVILKVHVRNIDLRYGAIVGPGIKPKYNEHKDDYYLCSVTVNEKGVADGMYKFTFYYDRLEGQKPKSCVFHVPVKV